LVEKKKIKDLNVNLKYNFINNTFIFVVSGQPLLPNKAIASGQVIMAPNC
jgi:hypothetical protein